MSRSERGARPGRPPSSSARGSCVGQGGLGVAGAEKAGGESAAMRRNGSAAVGFLAIVLACSPGNAWTADGRSPSVLTYRNERLSVRLVGVSLEEVMTNLGRAIGAQVYGTVPQPREVSVEFDDVPLVEALDRLLGEQNYVLKYGKGDRLRAIKLLGGPGVPIRTAATPAPTTPTPAPAVMRGWGRWMRSQSSATACCRRSTRWTISRSPRCCGGWPGAARKRSRR